MSMTKGTPASSQIIWLEGRVKELEDKLDAERERADTLHKAQPYLYIGKNGKTILARNLEDQRDAALANVAKLREVLEPLLVTAETVFPDRETTRHARAVYEETS